VIVDVIGVTRSLKTASQPLITKPSVPLKDLAMGVMLGANDTDTVSSLAGRLARLNKQLDGDDQARITQAAKGIQLTHVVNGLFDAIDADKVEAKAFADYLQQHKMVRGDSKCINCLARRWMG
jgi:type I restriction enzyme R subunit